MASLLQEREVIYGSDQDLNSGLSTEKVQGMANSIYSEFKRMMAMYGEDVIKELMPLIVTILETLDRSLTECNESVVEIEMLKDDNEQLATQFDRERQLRRTAEQQLLESEDSNETATRDVRVRADRLETTTRHLELKCKNYSDQVERLQEREAEIKREYTVLHDRHTEMIQSYMEHIEKTKVLQQQQSYTELSQSPRNKKDLPLVANSLSPGESPGFRGTFTPDSNQNIVHTPVATRPGLTSTPGGDRSHLCLNDELPKSLPATPTISTPSDDRTCTNDDHSMEVMGGRSAAENKSRSRVNATSKLMENLQHVAMLNQSLKNKKQINTQLLTTYGSSHKSESHSDNESISATSRSPPNADDSGKSEIKSPKAVISMPPHREKLTSPTKDMGSPSGESDGQGWVSAEVKEMLQNGEFDLEQPTPEGDQEQVDGVMESTGIENAVFEKTQMTNESSLYAELSQQDIGDVDEGADILGMSKEVENLIHENTKLLATKNALNVVKDDLIQQVDQLTTQHTLLKEELKISEKAKVDLNDKLKEFEKQLSKLQHELNNVASGKTAAATSKQSEEEEVLPMSQRKRFTRVEMARVLMERNQYKERLMELQEAVRWTETLRASRNHPDINQNKNKNKSTIFQFFSRLFTSNSGDNTSVQAPENQGRQMRRSLGSGDLGISMSYNAPTSKIMPRSRSTTASLYGRSPTIDTLREEPGLKQDPTKRELQPRIIDSNRFQACGWSLPNSPASPKEGSRTVPVPVYCGPLLDSEPNMKLWCATAVHLSDGRTRDGGSIVGTGSIFYAESKPDDGNNEVNEQQDTLPVGVSKLDEEIETQEHSVRSNARKRDTLSSFVWLVTGDARGNSASGGSKVSIMDACEPNRCIDKFHIGSNDTNILCITSVPGADMEDYTSGDNADSDEPATDTETRNDVETEQVSLSSSSSSHEVATEATEDLVSNKTVKKIPKRGVTEHIFTDPTNIHPTSSNNVNTTLSGSPKIGGIQKVQSPVLSNSETAVETKLSDAKVDVSLDSTRLASLQPTMWLGAQNGHVYVHSAINNWRKCLHQIRLKDSVMEIVHINGRALAALADGTVAFFRRNSDGIWNLSNYHLLDLGRPHHSIRCMSVVYDQVWCTYRNKIHIVEPKTMKIQNSFDAHPRRESQVRQLAWAGDGVWVSIRLDSTVRLYHARTLQHLQDVDVEPYVSKVLGSGKLGFSFVRITSLMTANHRLWIGTGNGVVMSVPLSEAAKSTSGRASTLERQFTCIKYQNTIAGCGIKGMRCLVCNKIIVREGMPSSSQQQCVCRQEGPQASQPHKKRTTKINKRAGMLLKMKFLSRKGAKTSNSSPLLSSSIRERPGGVIRVYSDPISEKITPGTFIPYCSMANAQLSFHGYRDAVKFFVAVPGCVTLSSTTSSTPGLSPPKPGCSFTNEGTLVLSGGEGYVDFRKGDLGALSPEEKRAELGKVSQSTLQNSHVIVWQLTHS